MDYIEDLDVGFDALSKLAYREAGLVLSSSKSAMIQSRLRHRLKALSISNLSDYCNIIEGESGRQELPHMISALTTNVTGFFREAHHFSLMKTDLLPKLLEKVEKGIDIRIWSAGCSTGQEPYSVAMCLLETSEKFLSERCKILATDIDTNVLGVAKHGVYKADQLEGVRDDLVHSFFTPTQAGCFEGFQASPELKSMISFRQLNLLDTWPMRGSFDIIFCRNVVIYFDAETQERLWPKFASKLTEDGTIFVGHSERISSSGFSSIGSTAYEKVSTT